jgi:hypothetical protein
MSTQYYSLCECFEMLADTTIPQLMAEFPGVETTTTTLLSGGASESSAQPGYVAHPEARAAANRLASAATTSSAPQPYAYFEQGEAEVARPHTIGAIESLALVLSAAEQDAIKGDPPDAPVAKFAVLQR